MKESIQLLINRINHSTGFNSIHAIESILTYFKTLNYNVLYNNFGSRGILIKGINITDAIKSANRTTNSGHTSFNS